MRIDLNTGAAVSGSHIEKSSSSHPAQHSTAQTAQLQSSESDTHVGKLVGQALSSPEVRQEKVQALQSQIQSGKYQVSATDVASSMLEQMRARGK